MLKKSILAVPNLAGVNLVVAGLARGSGRRASGLDQHIDPDHDRTVVTFAAEQHLLVDQCVKLAERAVTLLNLRKHSGQHPRFGSLDVLPVVPYKAPEEAALRAAEELQRRIEALGVPVHTYDRAHPERRTLPELRRWLSRGEHEAHPTAGVVCLGVRDPLIAFNVNFGGDIRAARAVARGVRETDVRAMGFELPSRGLVQVSMNLIAPERVGPRAAFDRVMALASPLPLDLVDCEVVGLVPHPNLAELGSLPLRRPARSIEQALQEKGLGT